jgi:hypothetical protein
VLQEQIKVYLELLTTFVKTKDEQLNAIHMSALTCSKETELTSVFHLLMQLFYKEEIFTGEHILLWVKTSET